jgi:uncharacterized membrane protein YkvA (DUF1232 family)
LHILAGRSGRAAALPATCSARTAACRAPCIASRYDRQNAQLIPARALSPIDPIPDFIPVLGYVDDALLLPALIWLAVRLLPVQVIRDCRCRQKNGWAKRRGSPQVMLERRPS